MPKVEVERAGPVTILWLNRPEVHHAIEAETARLLNGALLDVRDDEDARVLVVSGRGGKAFFLGGGSAGRAGAVRGP